MYSRVDQENWIFELTWSQRQDGSSAGSIDRTGVFALQASPFFHSHVLSDGSELRLELRSKPSNSTRSKLFPTRSLFQKIGRMLRPFPPWQPTSPPPSERSLSHTLDYQDKTQLSSRSPSHQPYEHQQSLVLEMPSIPDKMPELFGNDILELDAYGKQFIRGQYTTTVNNGEYTSDSTSRPPPDDSSSLRRQLQPSAEMPGQRQRMAPVMRRPVPAPQSPEISPTNEQGGYSSRSRIPPALTPASSSDPSSATGSPVSPDDYSYAHGASNSHEAWKNNAGGNRHDSFSSSPTVVDDNYSPSHRYNHAGADAGTPDSLSSARRGLFTQDYGNPSKTLGYSNIPNALPMSAAVSPPDFGRVAFDTYEPQRQQPRYSPSSQSFAEYGSSASPVPSGFGTGQYYISDQMYPNAPPMSAWERARNVIYNSHVHHKVAHVQQVDHVGAPHETLPSYSLQAPDQYQVHSIGGMSPLRRPSKDKKDKASKSTPLLCGQCSVVFSGTFARGNRERHIKAFHSTAEEIDTSRICCECRKKI